jgi:hypothetical protein
MTELTLTGGCLCGAVRYEVTGTPLRFLHCHCSRCRKATGTGHASNIIIKTDGVEWHGDASAIKRFKLPGAERFSTTFCTSCGGPLPREVGEIAVVPAGTVDAIPENLEPQGRIFWESRVEWSCEAGDLPSYAEYPTA